MTSPSTNAHAGNADGLTASGIRCLAGPLLLLDAALALFAILDWGHGLARAALLAGIGASLLALGLCPLKYRSGTPPGAGARRTVFAVAAILATLDAGFMVESLYHTAVTGQIRFDQGQNTYRGALGLLKGENPYGRGALLDIYAYRVRLPDRIAAGVGPHLPPSQVEDVLQEYWQTQNPGLKRILLPEAEGNGAAGQEVSLLGYKYGPVILLATTALVPVFGPLAVPLADIAVVLILFAALWLVLRTIATDSLTALVVLCAVMGDFQIIENFLFFSATDVWALMFGFLALLAALRGRQFAPAVLVGLSIGAKLFPGFLFVPLLFLRPSWRAFGMLGTVLLALAVPWLWADAHGFLQNVILWGSLMEADTTSWVYYTPPGLVLPLKILFACGAAFMAWRVVGAMRRGEPWFWAMGLMSAFAILLGNAFHNNYLSWVSLWAVLAVSQWAVPQTKRESPAF